MRSSGHDMRGRRGRGRRQARGLDEGLGGFCVWGGRRLAWQRPPIHAMKKMFQQAWAAIAVLSPLAAG